MEKTLTEQIKFRSAISLPLDQFKTRDLAFRLSLRPGQIQACTNSGCISPKSSRKASELWSLASFGLVGLDVSLVALYYFLVPLFIFLIADTRYRRGRLRKRSLPDANIPKRPQARPRKIR